MKNLTTTSNAAIAAVTKAEARKEFNKGLKAAKAKRKVITNEENTDEENEALVNFINAACELQEFYGFNEGEKTLATLIFNFPEELLYEVSDYDTLELTTGTTRDWSEVND